MSNTSSGIMRIYRGKFSLHHYADNEAITIIVPTSFRSGEPVYVFWKWTKTPAGCSDAPFFDVGTLGVKSIDGKTKMKITFLHDDYHFDIVLGYGLKSLFLVMKIKNGPVQDPAALELVYSRQVTDEESAPRLFTGAIDCSHTALGLSAVDEMFVIVSPKYMTDQQPLCAFWQWSKVNDDDSTKANVDCIDQIRTVTKTPTFTFVHGENFLFEGEVSESGKKLTATMKNANGKALSNFVLQEVQPIARLMKVFSSRVTTTFKNDSTIGEVVYCTLKEAEGSAVVDEALAWGGLALGLLGLPCAFVSGKGIVKKAITAVGKWVAGGGAITGGAGVVALKTGPGDSKSAMLHPGESMSRTSSFETTGSKNAVQIISAYIRDSDRALIIQELECADLGDQTMTLTEVRADTRSRTTILLELGIPNPPAAVQVISSHRLLTFRHLAPQGSGNPISDRPDFISGDVFATRYTATAPQLYSYGTLKALLDNAKTSESKRVFLFGSQWMADIDPAVKLSSGEDTRDYYQLYQLPDQTCVLKLFKCTIRGNITAPTYAKELPDWDKTDTGEKGTLALIYKYTRDPSTGTGARQPSTQRRDGEKYYWAYTNKDATLLGVYGQTSSGTLGGNQVVYTDDSNNTVYLVSKSLPRTLSKIVTKSS